MDENYIAERKLLYVDKNSGVQKELIIQISHPVRDEIGFVCPTQWRGLFDVPMNKYGIDPIHAMFLAVNVDPLLKGLAKNYNFFWEDGEPYFDSEDEISL